MDIDIIEKQLVKVSPEVKRAFFSVDVAKKIAEIGNSHGLLLDQVEDLIEEASLTMIGLKPQNELANTLASKLNVSTEISKQIVEDIHSKVMADIIKTTRIEIEKETLETPRNNTTLEQAGDFTIDNTQTAENDVSPLGKMDNNGESLVEQRPEILENIENPKPVQARTEPLVDHLLTTPTAIPQQEIKVTTPGSDPYREATK